MDKEAVSAAASAAASAMASRRMQLLGPKGRRELSSKAGKAVWANMSREERRLEMKRRYAVRRKRKAAEALRKAAADKAAKRAAKAKGRV